MWLSFDGIMCDNFLYPNWEEKPIKTRNMSTHNRTVREERQSSLIVYDQPSTLDGRLHMGLGLFCVGLGVSLRDLVVDGCVLSSSKNQTATACVVKIVYER